MALTLCAGRETIHSTACGYSHNPRGHAEGSGLQPAELAVSAHAVLKIEISLALPP
jgi:hypothetical protein